MIKTIFTIIKFTLIFALSATAIYGVLWLLGIMDWSLFKWASDLFNDIEWEFSDIFNYPNAWIFFSYIIGRDLLFFGIDLIFKKATKGADS